MKTIPKGLYRHYKGQDYRVLEVARHSETREYFVVYQCLYGDYSIWIRPFDMFTETVVIEDKEIPRFAFIKSMADDESE
jgi:hypothetical protein